MGRRVSLGHASRKEADSMKKIKVLIGANYGDEGKGLMTDYLAASHPEGLVIRFNGGAQAGHTVQLRDGRRHVFGHAGAGTFAGLPTFLSSFFVVNPMLFNREIQTLKDLGCNPILYADRECAVTTPYDMMVNQIAEAFRGAERHGSCGIGFNETIQRDLQAEDFHLRMADLHSETLVRERLDNIRKVYVPERLLQLGIFSIPAPFDALLASDSLPDAFLADANRMLRTLRMADADILNTFNTLIFEGAQGLMLDQSHAFFPHVTRSNTGMKNVVHLLAERDVETRTATVEILYMTRAYLTRHGAGPLPTELPDKPYPDIVDKTNMPNPHQGTLRYGLPDLDVLADTIRHDLTHAAGLRTKLGLGITCMDQTGGEIAYLSGSHMHRATPDMFVRTVMKRVGATAGFTAHGPTRMDIEPYTEVDPNGNTRETRELDADCSHRTVSPRSPADPQAGEVAQVFGADAGTLRQSGTTAIPGGYASELCS